ncbi:MAG: hypothetical protein Hens2KO_31300 [Henriciella sp.]
MRVAELCAQIRNRLRFMRRFRSQAMVDGQNQQSTSGSRRPVVREVEERK